MIVVLRIRSQKFDFQTASQSEITLKMWSHINLIPFPVFQASRDTSLEYPQHGILIRKIWPYFDPLAIFNMISD